MHTVLARVEALLQDYHPLRLLILGDLVHDRASEAEAIKFLEGLRSFCEVILIAGNHDRELARSIHRVESWSSEGFLFHHGHCSAESRDHIQVIGHHHPARTVHDGAGLRLKLPAFVQEGSCWILPAFSPWSGGTQWPSSEQTRIWLCSPQRILPPQRPDVAA